MPQTSAASIVPWARRTALLGSILLLSACSSGVVQCGACPPPLFVNLDLSGVSDQGPATLRVCVHQACTTQDIPRRDASAPDLLSVSLERGHLLNPADYDGAAVTASLTPASSRNLPSWAARATMEYTDGGDAVCSCSYSTATVAFSTNPTTEPESARVDATPS